MLMFQSESVLPISLYFLFRNKLYHKKIEEEAVKPKKQKMRMTNGRVKIQGTHTY